MRYPFVEQRVCHLSSEKDRDVAPLVKAWLRKGEPVLVPKAQPGAAARQQPFRHETCNVRSRRYLHRRHRLFQHPVVWLGRLDRHRVQQPLQLPNTQVSRVRVTVAVTRTRQRCLHRLARAQVVDRYRCSQVPSPVRPDKPGRAYHVHVALLVAQHVRSAHGQITHNKHKWRPINHNGVVHNVQAKVAGHSSEFFHARLIRPRQDAHNHRRHGGRHRHWLHVQRRNERPSARLQGQPYCC
mmetsp:Transcript_4399/g.14247  ORF Transcript_4399/g.14247 Transcript_4399/m.14247 type:complete len:240 (-) Transcript_4399:261-980(-)